MTLNKWVVTGVITASLVATIGLGVAAAFGSRDTAPDRAIIERIGDGSTVRWTVTSPAQVEQLYTDTVGLPDAPTGIYACPAIGSIYQYRVTFLAESDVVLVATFDPGGCRIVDLRPGGSRRAEGPPVTTSGATLPWRWASMSTRRR